MVIPTIQEYLGLILKLLNHIMWEYDQKKPLESIGIARYMKFGSLSHSKFMP